MKHISNTRFLKTLVIGAIITGALTWMVTSSLFITPLYRSEALIYVPLTIPSKQIEQQGIGFASDIEIDGHIQIFQSGRMRDSLTSRYNLAEKFGIDLSETGGLSRLYKAIDTRIKYKKTRFSSVSVTVLDPDPEKAAEMANTIVELGDIIKEDILYENRMKAFMQAQLHYENKLQGVEKLENKIDNLENTTDDNTKSNELFRLKNQYSIELQELGSRRNHLETVERDFKTELPRTYVISEAIPAAEPTWPRRKLIALASVFAYIFLLIVVKIIKQDVTSTG